MINYGNNVIKLTSVMEFKESARVRANPFWNVMTFRELLFNLTNSLSFYRSISRKPVISEFYTK